MMLTKRNKLLKDEKKKYDEWICEVLLKMVKNNDYKVVHTYLPMGSEINISNFIECLLKEKIVVVSPKTLPKRKLQHLILKSLDEVEKGIFGTNHPSNTKEYHGNYDLIIIPGLSFDRSKNRLGYGGGYYDAFLSQHPSARKVGIFYPFQEVKNVPVETHDIKLDEILVNRDLILPFFPKTKIIPPTPHDPNSDN